MEELQRKKTSRKGYRSHLTHFFKKVDTILNSDSRPNDKQTAILTSAVKQFTERATMLQQLDNEICSTIQNEDELEADTIESVAMQEAIQDKLTEIKVILYPLIVTTTRPLNVAATEFVPTSSDHHTPLPSYHHTPPPRRE